MQQHGAVVVGGDFHIIEFGGRSFLEAFYSAARLAPDGEHGREIGAYLGDFASGQPGDSVEHVGADIGDGAQLASQLRFQAPVPVGGIKKPILQEAAMHEARLADCAFGDQRASFLSQRVIAQVVGDAADPLLFFGNLNQLRAFDGIHGERFLAHNVLSGFQSGF